METLFPLLLWRKPQSPHHRLENGKLCACDAGNHIRLATASVLEKNVHAATSKNIHIPQSNVNKHKFDDIGRCTRHSGTFYCDACRASCDALKCNWCSSYQCTSWVCDESLHAARCQKCHCFMTVGEVNNGHAFCFDCTEQLFDPKL